MANEVVLNLSEIPKYFGDAWNRGLCAMDVIAYVRSQVSKDPWDPVIIKTKDKPVAVTELENYGIFWDGVNSEKAETLLGISVTAYCVIDIATMDAGLEDCGLEKRLQEFRESYHIQNFEVLVFGKDDSKTTNKELNALLKLKEYVTSNGLDGFFFPQFIVSRNKLRSDGIDISTYVRDLMQARDRNALDAAYLDDLLEKLEGQVVDYETVVQDISELRTVEVKLLSLYLTLKHVLPPAYVSSFIAEYTQYEYFYPRTKLSLYERVNFLRKLPPAVGFLGKNPSFNCLAKVTEKIYPHPHYVFDLSTKRVLGESELRQDTWEISNPSIVIADFRGMFRESQIAINYSAGLTAAGSSDANTDKQLVDLFTELSAQISEEPVYLSIKNTLLVRRGGKNYLMYCPEELGVKVIMMSEYFGLHEKVIGEGEFNRIIDAQHERAILKRDRASTSAKGNKELAVIWKTFQEAVALQPAIPLETSLYMNLLPLHQNGLSYYDRRLRCHANVLPLVTSIDSPLCDVSPLFKDIALEDLRSDPLARYSINCFGTLAQHNEHNPTLPITYKAFRRKELL